MSKNIIKIGHEVAANLVKRVSVLSDGNLSLFCGKDKDENLFLQAEVALKDETKQIRDAVKCELGGKDAETINCVVRASDFVAMANEILAFDKEADLILEQIAGKLVIKNKKAKLDISILDDTVGMQKIGENSLLMAKIFTADATHIFKDICKFHDPDGTQRDELKNMEFVFRKDSLMAEGSTGFIFGYNKVNIAVKPGKLWDTAVADFKKKCPDEEAVRIGVPGIFTGFLASALSTTAMESVVIIVDDKYLHLRIDEKAMASVRLTDKVIDFAGFKKKFEEEAECGFVVDKALFDGAVKIIEKKLSMEKAVGAGVPVRITNKGDKAIILEVCENKVEVPVVAGEVDDLDVYVIPRLLSEVTTPMKAGNLLIKVVAHNGGYCVLVGNGSTEEGFKEGSAKALAMSFAEATAKERFARFAAGKSDEDLKKEQKAEEKSKKDAAKKEEEVGTDGSEEQESA